MEEIACESSLFFNTIRDIIIGVCGDAIVLQIAFMSKT